MPVRRTFPASHPERESAAVWKDEPGQGKRLKSFLAWQGEGKAPRLLSPGRQERLRPRLPGSASLVFVFSFFSLHVNLPVGSPGGLPGSWPDGWTAGPIRGAPDLPVGSV